MTNTSTTTPATTLAQTSTTTTSDAASNSQAAARRSRLRGWFLWPSRSASRALFWWQLWWRLWSERGVQEERHILTVSLRTRRSSSTILRRLCSPRVRVAPLCTAVRQLLRWQRKGT
jgi:hypothetical protein